ncbi:MAG: hypothetical protein EPO20_20315 [Betaproteobacteria bacterium]|nr:MAG: hypothetical protein EPO20_20315 [Betaproteobacteria bacterium]
MKIVSLHLRGYGPFTNVVLPFEKHPAGLQIVFGPNEAGKSSALRAVGAFLFGISAQTTDSFLHEYSTMRVGAVLVGEDNKRHALMRRKGNKNVLFAFDEVTGEERADRALASDYIAQLLPGVDEKLFESLFGLSHERLRTGGKALIAGEGDLGSAIFAAGSGLGGVRATLSELEDMARALFLPAGKNAGINAALREHDNSKIEFRNALVRPKTWKELDYKVTEETQELKALEAEERRLRTQETQKQRLIDLRPRAVKRQNLLHELTELDGVVKLPEDAGKRSTSAQERINATAELIAAASARIEANTATLAGLVISGAHFKAATEIEALHHQASPAREEYDRLAGLAGTTQQQKEAIAALVEDLDPAHSPEMARELVPPTALVARVRLYCRQLTQVDFARAAAEQKAHDAQEDLERTLTALEAITAPGDTSALEAALENLQRQGDLEKTLAAAAGKRTTIAEEVKRLCAGLEHPEEILFSLPIPQRTSLVAFQGRFQSLAKAVQRLETKEAELHAHIADCRQEIKGLEAVGNVVTADSVAVARERRDEVWSGVRSVYVEKSEDEQAVSKGLGLQQRLPEAYERHVKATDEQADLLRADTARTTEYSSLQARIQAMGDELSNVASSKTDLAEQKSLCEKEWGQVLTTLKLKHRSPEALLEWLIAYEKVKARAGDRDTIVAEEETAKRAISEGFAVLAAGYAQAGLQKPELPTLAALITHAKGQLKLANDRRNDIGQFKKDKLRAEQAIRAAKVELAKHKSRRDSLVEEAKADLALVRLKEAALIDEIEARLETINALSKSLDDIKQTEAKTKAAQAAWESFVARMAQLAKQLGLPGVERPEEWVGLAGSAYAELKLTRERASEADKLNSQIKTDTALIASETAKQRVAQEILNDLVQLAKCGRVEELAAAIEASERRRRAERALEELDSELSQYSQDELSGLLAAAAGSDLGALQAELAEVQRGLQELEPQIETKRTAVAEAKSRLATVDGSAAALAAKEQMEHYAALMQREAANYARARFAQALLTNAIRAYQEKSQGPLIERASAWFSAITQGRYSRLVVDHHDDEQVLIAEMNGGRRLHTWELSEGTADQLYLALRLAAIQLRLDTNEATPLILDDALVAFDDDRTVTALKALTELGRKNQTILFTHHQHVIELARKNLRADDFAVHELPQAKVLAAV